MDASKNGVRLLCPRFNLVVRLRFSLCKMLYI
jgi:hypothetical protein